ncbi:MAG: response regulator transcription factor [Candidatus Thorarchaeota archaeon]
MSIILANDVPFLTGLMKLTITDMGYSVVGEASQMSELLDICEKLVPDLVIADLQLPEKESIRLIEEILDIDSSITIIMVSELIEGYSEKVLASGAMAYLQKPYTTHDLIDIIRKVTPILRHTTQAV